MLNWYFKGFELLRRYLTKHNPRVDLESLDFEAVDKEMEAEAATEGNTPKAKDKALEPMVRDDAVVA